MVRFFFRINSGIKETFGARFMLIFWWAVLATQSSRFLGTPICCRQKA